MENIRLAFQSIWNHKLRSFLTMLGIIIGIASLITIVSTIKGTNQQIKENLIGAGGNVVTVQLYRSGTAYDLAYEPLPTTVRPIAEVTRQALEALDGVEAVALYHHRDSAGAGDIYYKSVRFSGNVYGVDTNYFDVTGYQIIRGRGFTQADYDQCRKVILVDSKAAASLFGNGEPVGQVVEIRGETFTVIGVVGQMTNFTPNIQSLEDYYLYADTSGGGLYLPDTSWPIVYRFDEPQNVAVKALSTDDMTAAGKNVAQALTDSQVIRTQVAEGQEESASEFSYRSEDLLEQAQQLQEMSEATNRQLLWIAAISLLVGGIGVMNIMLVSVTERTSEIGLKKALGAKRRRILGQFLMEACVLTFLGGLLGVTAGLVLAQLLSQAGGVPVAISVPYIVIAVAFSTFMGVAFGIIPAIKASKLNPIDALRR